jgi:hypothetical protein
MSGVFSTLLLISQFSAKPQRVCQSDLAANAQRPASETQLMPVFQQSLHVHPASMTVHVFFKADHSSASAPLQIRRLVMALRSEHLPVPEQDPRNRKEQQ